MFEKEQVVDILKEICNIDSLEEHGDLDLFDNGLLDSLGVIELLVELEEKLGIKIEPTEIEREDIKTPNKIIEYLSKRDK